jgi:hypothetical protein
MFKVVVLSSLVLLGGCMVYNDRSIPSAVTSMPRDCANERAILDWLDYQSGQERGMFTNEEAYAQDQRTIKYHKWRFKYICSSVN